MNMVCGAARHGILTVVCVGLTACKGSPARIVVGNADTVIVNNRRPVQLPVRVLDAAGRALEPTSVKYEWTAGVPISVSPTGTTTCTQPGDATVRASLGALVTDVLVRCRPVRDVRGLLMMNLVVGDPPQDVPFEAVGTDGQPVTLISAQLTIDDSTVATLEGQRIRARVPGSTHVTIRVGDRRASASVHVYERVSTPEHIRPGQHLAVPVQLTDGGMRRWRIPASPEVFFVTMLPNRDGQPVPRLAIVGANCSTRFGAQLFFCLAQRDASVIAYHPQHLDRAQELSGTLAVWRQERP